MRDDDEITDVFAGFHGSDFAVAGYEVIAIA